MHIRTYPKISKETDTKPPASAANNNNNYYYYQDIKIVEAISANLSTYRPNPLTQCCTQFKSPGVKILCVLLLN